MCGDANQDCYLAIRFANSFIYSPHCVFAVFRGLEPDERMTYAHIAFLSMKAAWILDLHASFVMNWRHFPTCSNLLDCPGRVRTIYRGILSFGLWDEGSTTKVSLIAKWLWKPWWTLLLLRLFNCFMWVTFDSSIIDAFELLQCFKYRLKPSLRIICHCGFRNCLSYEVIHLEAAWIVTLYCMSCNVYTHVWSHIREAKIFDWSDPKFEFDPKLLRDNTCRALVVACWTLGWVRTRKPLQHKALRLRPDWARSIGVQVGKRSCSERESKNLSVKKFFWSISSR